MELSYKKRQQKFADLIRKVGMAYEEEPVFLEEYIKDQVKTWSHDLDRAIMDFQLIWEQTKLEKGIEHG